ncbi:hypothetical protein L226DRAFT_572834 [Lentinus tigrinus ALCF2SS1-7]|uniref:uncharacterized protein n=1 Tax=Lentinus tigrinus ALCF2SS1-7 TaxID=1328758 RepID=UPI00116608E1|nr:hypothetical protein L226DRAFT_572834 [Lentinus tigrinus ALCF2SS1-7]
MLAELQGRSPLGSCREAQRSTEEDDRRAIWPVFLSVLIDLVGSNPHLLHPHIPALLKVPSSLLLPVVDAVARPNPGGESTFVFPPVVQSTNGEDRVPTGEDEGSRLRKPGASLSFLRLSPRLTDYAGSRTPTYLPFDDPSFFFDTSGRRSCYIAPERFYTASENPDISAKKSKLASEDGKGKRELLWRTRQLIKQMIAIDPSTRPTFDTLLAYPPNLLLPDPNLRDIDFESIPEISPIPPILSVSILSAAAASLVHLHIAYAEILLAHDPRIPSALVALPSLSDLVLSELGPKGCETLKSLTAPLEHVEVDFDDAWVDSTLPESSASDARIPLSRSVEVIPQCVELWLALARLETPDEAKAALIDKTIEAVSAMSTRTSVCPSIHPPSANSHAHLTVPDSAFLRRGSLPASALSSTLGHGRMAPTLQKRGFDASAHRRLRDTRRIAPFASVPPECTGQGYYIFTLPPVGALRFAPAEKRIGVSACNTITPGAFEAGRCTERAA